MTSARWQSFLFLAMWAGWGAPLHAADTVDFNRDIRPLLSNYCYKCHGPDDKERQGGSDGLRLDTAEGAYADQGGTRAVVPGQPAESELLRRVTAEDPDERMPPPSTGWQLTAAEIDKLTEWIRQGGTYARHWSYTPPLRPSLPEVQDTAWPRNAIDRFLLARMEREGLRPSALADRYALIRRLSLDLTGLPPSLEEVQAFVGDNRQDAYERLVERLLDKETFGEHWARMWLDLARYADSAGYADDPSRTIWAFRDYVICAFNANKPFDQFTIEQLAGDLLSDAGEERLMATAFHRNTLTNSEGGTNDEEFRSVAIVDRVNTTWSVWMGTSMACAQCHNHKYDPISQEEFFRFYAILNNTEDADRRDEAPVLEFFTADQRQQRSQWESEIQRLEQTMRTPTPEILAGFQQWDDRFPRDLAWQSPSPSDMKSLGGAVMSVQDDQAVVVTGGQKSDTYVVSLPLPVSQLAALRIEALPHESLPEKGPGHAQGRFVVSRVSAEIAPPDAGTVAGRFVRITVPGKGKILSLAEVQVLRQADNLASRGTATQSSTDFEGPPALAIDGNTNGKYNESRSVTHTAISDDPWWEVDLQSTQSIDRIVIWNRTDPGVEGRLADFRITLLDEQRQPVWEKTVAEAPQPSAEFRLSGVRPVAVANAWSTTSREGFDPRRVLGGDPKQPESTDGWANPRSAAESSDPLALSLPLEKPLGVQPGSTLRVTLAQQSRSEYHTLGCFRISVSGDPRLAEFARLPANVTAILTLEPMQRSDDQRRTLVDYYLAEISPELQGTRDQLARVRKQLEGMKANTVPILRELAGDKRRVTHLQYRGNFLDLGPEVKPGTPRVFTAVGGDQPPDRLAMARWLVSPANPLTARVITNRFWEQIFGLGLVRTSEEFGAQGELPSHPELLDWLAVEFMESGWNIKHMLGLLVNSAAYRQSSQVSPELLEQDPENRLLARGPRFRLSAEMVRDQALFVSGLLSSKMYGPSVKPPQPALGLNAAFGSAIDWKTSEGEDRFRRGLYTEWRRSNPYPSMITFDAPNREVCTLRRARTNTPLQALVTLNDPVYIECAQGLARRILATGTTTAERAAFGFRACLARPPYDHELQRLVQLYDEARDSFASDPNGATEFATNPLGPAPPGADVSELAAWTVVANVLLNLDEMLMKR